MQPGCVHSLLVPVSFAVTLPAPLILPLAKRILSGVIGTKVTDICGSCEHQLVSFLQHV